MPETTTPSYAYGWTSRGALLPVADLLNDAVQWIAERLHAYASRQVTYSRGTESVTLSATAGKTLFEVDRGGGVVEHSESRDFLVRAAELILSGAPVLPQRGDRIADAGQVYEVMAPGNEPHYRFADPYRTMLRIHTRQVS
jgi:hypothetical protein